MPTIVDENGNIVSTNELPTFTPSDVVAVPGWAYDLYKNTKGTSGFLTVPADDAYNYVEYFAGLNDNGAAYKKFAKYVTGNANAALSDVAQAWSNVVNLSVKSKVSTTNVINNKLFDASRFYNTSFAASSKPSIQRTISVTSAENANADLLSAMTNLLGRQPTKNEYNDYLKKLNAAERKTYRTTTYTETGQTTTGTELDRQKFLTTYVLGKAEWAKDLQGDLGVAQDIVEKAINDNGLSKVATKNQRIQYLKQFAKGELKQDALNSQLAELAATTYPAWSSMVKPGMTMKDAAASWLNVYQNTLEIDPETADLSEILSKSVDATGKVMSVYDFQKSLRKDARYQYTGNAHREAAAFGKAFARSMGVNL